MRGRDYALVHVGRLGAAELLAWAVARVPGSLELLALGHLPPVGPGYS